MSINFKHLKNTYFVIRHGQSQANVERKVISSPSTGISSYGLTPLGRRQVTASAREFRVNNLRIEKTLTYASDFLRTRETAEILASVLDCEVPVELSPNLRERFFGELDGQDDISYQQVWREDALNQHHQQWGVESVASVRDRVCAHITEIEVQHVENRIILVGHGDVLQIAQTLFDGIPGEQHRQLPHLEVAEIRLLYPQ